MNPKEVNDLVRMNNDLPIQYESAMQERDTVDLEYKVASANYQNEVAKQKSLIQAKLVLEGEKKGVFLANEVNAQVEALTFSQKIEVIKLESNIANKERVVKRIKEQIINTRKSLSIIQEEIRLGLHDNSSGDIPASKLNPWGRK